MTREWMKVLEVARWLGVGKNTVYAMIYDQTLPALRHGRTIRIYPEDVKRVVRKGRGES